MNVEFARVAFTPSASFDLVSLMLPLVRVVASGAAGVLAGILLGGVLSVKRAMRSSGSAAAAATGSGGAVAAMETRAMTPIVVFAAGAIFQG